MTVIAGNISFFNGFVEPHLHFQSLSSLFSMAVKDLPVLQFLSLNDLLKITDLLNYSMILLGIKLIPCVSIL